MHPARVFFCLLTLSLATLIACCSASSEKDILSHPGWREHLWDELGGFVERLGSQTDFNEGSMAFLLLIPLFQGSTACLPAIRMALECPENIPLSTKRFKVKMALPKIADKMHEFGNTPSSPTAQSFFQIIKHLFEDQRFIMWLADKAMKEREIEAFVQAIEDALDVLMHTDAIALFENFTRILKEWDAFKKEPSLFLKGLEWPPGDFLATNLLIKELELKLHDFPIHPLFAELEASSRLSVQSRRALLYKHAAASKFNYIMLASGRGHVRQLLCELTHLIQKWPTSFKSLGLLEVCVLAAPYAVDFYKVPLQIMQQLIQAASAYHQAATPLRKSLVELPSRKGSISSSNLLLSVVWKLCNTRSSMDIEMYFEDRSAARLDKIFEYPTTEHADIANYMHRMFSEYKSFRHYNQDLSSLKGVIGTNSAMITFFLISSHDELIRHAFASGHADQYFRLISHLSLVVSGSSQAPVSREDNEFIRNNGLYCRMHSANNLNAS